MFTVLQIHQNLNGFREFSLQSFRCSCAAADFLSFSSHPFARPYATLQIPSLENNHMINDVTTLELRLVLKISGYSQADFARYINRSPAFVNGLCSCFHSPVPFRWVELARKMIGDETFNDALVEARVKLQYQTANKFLS